MPAIIFSVILVIAGIINLIAGHYVLGACRLFGVFLAVVATVLIAPAYSAAAAAGSLSPLVILVYLPLALGEICGRTLSEWALRRQGVRMRTLSSNSEPDQKA